jgi:hypothetical protein
MNATLSRLPALLALVLAGAIFALFCGIQPADAANLNAYFPTCPAILTHNGIRTMNCPVVRSPIAPGNLTADFYVDGQTNLIAGGHASVLCSMLSQDFTGIPLASRSFSATDQAFDAFLSFSLTEVPYRAYVSLNCEIYDPSVLLGITALQPEAVPGAAAVASVSDTEQRARDRSAFTTHVAAIAEAFNEEARDPQWSSEAAALLKSVLSIPDLQGLEVKGIDCRTTTCRVDIVSANPAGLSAQVPLLTNRSAGMFSSMRAQPLADGSTLALYLSHEKKN